MPRTRTNLLAGAVLAATTAAAAAGCSSDSSPSAASTPAPAGAVMAAGSNASNVGLSGPRLLTAFKSAAASGTAVHVVGKFDEAGSPYALDMNLNKNGTTAGSISQSGAAIPVRVVDNVTYIQLTPAFLKLEAQSNPSITAGVINLVQNKWISSQSSMGQEFASSLAGLTTYDSFIGTLENGGGSAAASASMGAGASASASSPPAAKLSDLTPAGTTTYNGKTVAVYKSPNGSTAFFDASGPAYLEKVTTEGAESGETTYTWNKPVKVVAPQPSEIFST
jgi:hypothetical protein